MPAILKLANLTKRFGQKQVLDKVNIEIEKGEIFGFIGMSGMGKTTLLECIIGFLDVTEGDVQFIADGPAASPVSILQDEQLIRQNFGFSAQNPSFYPNLTVSENLDYFGTLYGMSEELLKTNIDTALKLVGLYSERDTIASTLSGGMQKRLDIACAIVHNPKILILDEPTADLDILLRRQVWDLIKKINARGTTIIIASHFLHEMEMLCHRLAVLHNRKILAVGPSEQIKSEYSKADVIKLKTSPGRYKDIVENLKKRVGEMRHVVFRDTHLIIYTPSAAFIVSHLLQVLAQMKERIVRLDVSKPTIDEVFEAMTKLNVVQHE